MKSIVICAAVFACLILGCQKAPKYAVELVDVLPDVSPPAPRPNPKPDGQVLTNKVHEPKTYNEYNELVQKAAKAKQPIAINIGATWCHYCVKMAPHFKKISGEYKDMVFIKVNTDKWSEDDRTKLIIKAQLKAYPKTFVKYPDREWKNVTGYMEETVLRNYLGPRYNMSNSLYFSGRTLLTSEKN